MLIGSLVSTKTVAIGKADSLMLREPPYHVLVSDSGGISTCAVFYGTEMECQVIAVAYSEVRYKMIKETKSFAMPVCKSKEGETLFGFLHGHFCRPDDSFTFRDLHPIAPVARVEDEGGECTISFYELPEGLMGWWDETVGQMVVTEEEMTSETLLEELANLCK